METEQALRRRIKTVGDLRAIVRTMKALAAVSGRQYEAVLKSLSDYSRTVEMGLQVALHGRVFEKPSRQNPPDRVAAVIFGSDVGLCGRFNEDLVNLALDKLKGLGIPPAGCNILAVGTRIESRLLELDLKADQIISPPCSPAGIITTVRQILLTLDEWQDQSIDRVLLFYSQAGTPTLFPLLPIDLGRFSELPQKPWPSRVLPTYSLDSEHLLAALIRQHVFISLYRACAESLAAENQLRLRAMQAAQQNIQDKYDELVLAFRNQHQDAIDAELLDISTGFEAVSGQP